MVHYFFQNFLFFSGLPLPDEGNCAVLLFRFQNVRSPKYSAFWALAPDGQASRSPSAKDRLPGWRPPVFEAEYKGLLTFFHSHSKTAQFPSSGWFWQNLNFIIRFLSVQKLLTCKRGCLIKKTDTGYSSFESFLYTISCICFASCDSRSYSPIASQITVF